MKRRDFGKNMAIFLAGAPLVPGAFSFPKKEKMKVTIGESQETFPTTAAYYTNTNPTFAITKNGHTEVLVLDGTLHFTTKNPGKKRDGLRYIDITLDSWNGSAYSNLLGKEVRFEVTNTLKSGVKSHYLNQDFPSTMEMNFEYNIYFDGELAIKDASARACSQLETFSATSANLYQIESNNLVTKNNNIEIIFCAA
ncbi:MAG: hypothetical protein H6Q26_171 [Bacteroidetes bacterium]|nr:hypothetical protein [Bacteroidota bacterium]